MLVRAARRQKLHRLSPNVLNSFDQLQLPWLCPSIDRHVRRSRKSSNVATQPGSLQRSSSRSPSRALSTTQNTRQLATFADVYSSIEDYIPWQDLSMDQKRLALKGDTLTDIKPLNTKQLVTLSTNYYTKPPVFKAGRMSTITGDISDLLPNLHACVQVGRMDRAANLIRKMAEIFAPTAPELIDAHYQYLTGLLNIHLDAPTKETFANLKRWFEMEVRARNVLQDSRMFSIMIKGSFALLKDGQLDRSLRRYVEMAELVGPQVKEDTLASELFNDHEWAKLLRLFPQEYETSKIDTTQASMEPSKAETVDPIIVDLSKPAKSTVSPRDILPELKEADLKGSGLRALKRSLVSMYESIESMEMDGIHPDDIARYRQEKLEKDVIEASLERWREQAEDTQARRARGQITNPLLGSYVHEWVQETTELIKEEIALATSAEERLVTKKPSEDRDRLLIGPFLRFSDPTKLAAAAIIAFLSTALDVKGQTGPDKTLVIFVSRVGKAVLEEIELESVKSDILEKLKALPSMERRRRLAKLLRTKSETSNAEDKESSTLEDRPSTRLDPSNGIKAKIGALFVTFIMKVARLPITRTDPLTKKSITKIQPVASHTWSWRAGKRMGVIRVNPELMLRLKKEPVGDFLAKCLPMIVEPKKWQGLFKGPYLSTELAAVRFRDSSRSQQEYLRIADKRGDLKQVYAGLDVIGKVPWKVNRSLFKVLTEAWNSGEAIGKLAPAEPKADYPRAPDASDHLAYRRWRSLVKSIENEVVGFHSQRCYQNFQLEVARAFIDEDTFYCPHNMDFRGRAYPIPPYFNHMGADYIRALFLFANGKELGDTGLKWLKIHLANSYGYDKERLTDREAFTMEHLADIYDSASNPLGGKRWWLTAGHPWQCLAACIELKAALDSPFPSKYVSHLPIQQDGTCNGLQHYAALGGDSIGAKQVNLMPGDKPADIYTAVADVVKEEIRKAAANGDKAAQVLDGNITRKVVKQPVMTNVYGVTYHGAKEQVRRQLMDIMPKASLDNDIHLGVLSGYVTSLIFGALGQMFNGAQAIQQWLGECGGRISQAVTPEQIERIKDHRNNDKVSNNLLVKQIKSKERDAAKEDYQFKSTIVWTTPLGLPVVQPYRSAPLKIIKTSLQNIAFEDSTMADPVSKRRQLQGFPPNFIHSLDSSHMMLSALKCDELGLTFASVHDSFWTHASDVPFMNRVLRDAFVRMHSEDIIGRLREEFVARYKGCFNYTSIHVDSPVGQKISKLRRSRGIVKTPFLRQSVVHSAQVDELLMEYERTQLLQSGNPEEQRRGREMVTPWSLLEAEPDAALPPSNEDDVNVLGQKDDKVRAAISGLDIEVPGVVSAEDEDVPADLTPFGDDLENADEPVVDESVPDDELVDDENVPEEEVLEASETAERVEKRPPRTSHSRICLWMPISFPQPPKKGGFDVSTLKDSQYFFS